jgi:hypothetical protein
MEGPFLRIVIPFYTEFEALKPGLRALLGSGIRYEYLPCQGPYVHSNRNNGINSMRSDKTRQEAVEGFSHFLFLDSDISFNPHHIHTALRHNAPVVALPYLRHEADGTYQAGELAPDAPTVLSHYSRLEKGVKHVTFCGGGFLLVQRHVFGALTYPWFHHTIHTNGESSYSVGEDIQFCVKLRKAGIPILMDFDHPVPHRPRRKSDFNVSI